MTESTDTPAPDNAGGTPTPTPAPPPTPHAPPASADTDLTAEVSKWKTLSRSHEQKWQKASGDLERLQQQVTERDVALNDTRTEAARSLAVAQLEARLARAGMPEEAAANYVKFLDAGRLVKDGTPDPDAIGALVAELPASLRSGPPDPDQGRRSDNAPLDMNRLIRRQAGLA